MGSFALDLSKFADLSESKMVSVTKKASIGLFTDIIRDTPVAQGRLKGNWQPAVNKFADTSVLDIDKTRKGSHSAQSKAKITQEFNTVRAGDTLTLTNNLPYAEAIEFGRLKTATGFSAKAPAGMVRINVIRWQKHLDEQARKL